MKKNILIVATAVFAMLVVACSKENVIPEQEEIKSMPITISASYKGDNAKITYTESGNTISAKWQSGDEILVAYDGRVSTLSLASGSGTTSATFTGTIYYTHEPSENSILSCYVRDQNNSSALVDNGDGTIIYSDAAFLNQNGTVAGAGKCNTFFGMAKFGDGTDIKCEFSVNTAILKFQVFAPNDVAAYTSGATLTYKSGSVDLAKATFSVGYGGRNTIYLAVPVGAYSGLQTLVYKSGETEVSKTLSPDHATFATGQTYSKTLFYGDINIGYLEADYVAQDGDVMTGSLSAARKITIADGATVTLKGVSINATSSYSGDFAGLTCIGDATVILKAGTTNTIKGFSDSYPGIQVGPTSKTLKISGTGTLTTSGASGIGSASQACGNIEIENGTVSATGNYGAGIGCYTGNCGSILITGGTVTAIGVTAGMGNYNQNQSCGNITISGGSVTAKPKNISIYYHGVGIGSSYNGGSCGNILINGGTVNATGSGRSGAAIGSAYPNSSHNTSCGTITITSDATVIATKGTNSDANVLCCIGKGYNSDKSICSSVSIGGITYWDGSTFQNGGDTYLTQSTITYPTTK